MCGRTSIEILKLGMFAEKLMGYFCMAEFFDVFLIYDDSMFTCHKEFGNDSLDCTLPNQVGPNENIT